MKKNSINDKATLTFYNYVTYLAHLATIIESSEDAIFSVDTTGKILTWNEGAEKILGYTKEEIIGKSRLLFLPKQKIKEDKIIQKKINSGEAVTPIETRYVAKDNQLVSASLAVAPIKNTEGIIYGASFILRDITEQKLLEKRKDDFLSMASHELKTPVTTIKAFTQILQKMQPTMKAPESKRYLEKIDKQVTKLIKIINELLDVSRIRSGRLIINKERFNFDQLIKEVLSAYRSINTDHEITLHGHTKKTIFADRDRIAQVLTNLINNAIKYSPGKKKINVLLFYSKKRVYCFIKDYGIGISRTNQKKIFEDYYRVIENDDNEYPGLGIGLAIVSEIIRLHQGDIAVKSLRGKGSTFSFWLPIE